MNKLLDSVVRLLVESPSSPFEAFLLVAIQFFLHAFNFKLDVFQAFLTVIRVIVVNNLVAFGSTRTNLQKIFEIKSFYLLVSNQFSSELHRHLQLDEHFVRSSVELGCLRSKFGLPSQISQPHARLGSSREFPRY